MANDQFNLTGLVPLSQVPNPGNTQTPTGTDGYNLNGIEPVNPSEFHASQLEEKYGTPAQQLLTGVEGAGQGFAGPVATGIEAGLSKAGVPGLSPAEQQARAETNPLIRHGTEVGGFIAGDLTGVGEAAMLGRIGEAAKVASGLGQGASIISKIAATGVKAGAELSALQAGEEASKFINQDPSQTLGSAAINIGLSGIIGTGGGMVLGAVSPLFKTAANSMGIGKLANDFIGETKFLQDNPDMVGGAKKELEDRMAEVENMRTVLGEAKPELIAKAVPEATPENIIKINQQLDEINTKMQATLESAAKSVKTKSAVPYIGEDYATWHRAVTAPEATIADQFMATNKLKQDLASYAKWGLTEEGSAKAQLGKDLSSIIRPMLEDRKIWGAAGDIQKVTNEAVTQAIRANDDLLPKVTSKLMGEREVDPNKLQTYFNQVEKGKAGLKTNVIRNYLDTTQKYADAINKVHLDNGLEAPINSTLNSTTILDRSLNTPISPGRSLAQWANQKGAGILANQAGELAGGGIGAGLGALVGHPIVGAVVGEKLLTPIFSVLAKPFAEKAVNSSAMRSSIDYAATAMKGQASLNRAVENVLKAGRGVEVLPKSMMPSRDSRDKLQKALESLDNPQNLLKVGGNIGYYMPDHGSVAGSTVASAKDYLDGIRPMPMDVGPLDKPAPLDKNQTYLYDRALDIAQQPLVVLQHVRNGSLLPQDVQTLNTIYPGLAKSMSDKLGAAVVEHHANGGQISFAQRNAIQMLTGMPLSTINSQSMPQQQPQQNQQVSKSNPKPATGVMLKQINKVNELYATDVNRREMNKRT